MLLRTILLLVLVNISFSQKISFQLRKCCGEKERLDSLTKKCIHFDDETFSNDSLRSLATIVIETLGLPNDQQLYNLSVLYNTLTDTQLDVTEAVIYDSEFANNINSFENRVSATLIDERRSCFDISTFQNRTKVLLSSVKLKSLNKCCGKGKTLNSSSLRCESRPGKVQQEIDEEIIFPEKDTEDYNWVPIRFSKNVIKVKYDFRNYSFYYNFKKNFNVYKWNTVARDEKDVFWILYNYPRNPPAIIMKKLNASAKVTDGVTEIFCFEEVSEGPLAPRALLAVVYNVRKCCGKGMQYSKDFASCVQRPNQPEEIDVFVDVVDWQTNPDAAYWLPTSLRSYRNISVKYWNNRENPVGTAFVYDENLWTISRYEGIPEVALNVTLLSGESFGFKTTNFCFEYIEDNMAVLVMKEDFLKDSVMKCCYPGEIISRNGQCMKYRGIDWTPGLSERRTLFNSSITPTENINYPLKPQCRSFATQATNTPRAIQHFGGKHKDEDRWQTVFYCNDFQMKPDGGVKEVVGSCSNRPTANAYANVRPLGVVSAIVLAAAAITAVTQEETRRSAHGRALACHALCLCLADTLQVAWFFQTPGRVDPNCDIYAYCIYFFMTSANFWLTSITMNMARGFRQPLGALAGQKGGGAVWKRFGVMSAFAWGGSIVLSTIAIAIHHHRRSMFDLGIISPSFFETRTCTFENTFYALYYLFPGKESAGGRLGTLFYYYVPMAILVLTNAICVILTVCTVRSLQRDKAFLQRDTTNPTQSLHNVLLYAKLLLTAGIAELILEAVTWATGGRRRLLNLTIDWNDSIERSYIFTIVSTFIDLTRAVTVFWLCAGRQCYGVGAVCGKAKERLVKVFNGQKKKKKDQTQDIETHL